MCWYPFYRQHAQKLFLYFGANPTEVLFPGEGCVLRALLAPRRGACSLDSTGRSNRLHTSGRPLICPVHLGFDQLETREKSQLYPECVFTQPWSRKENRIADSRGPWELR